MLQGSDRTNRRAKGLRREMTLPEVLLWQRLKLRPNGLKFRRQHPAGRYVLDFYCHEARLIVEIDGIAHNMGERPERDIKRDQEFAAKGLRTVRIPASDVLRDPDGVTESIAALAAAEE
jgi:very-short-patch-repair endonuclease